MQRGLTAKYLPDLVLYLVLPNVCIDATGKWDACDKDDSDCACEWRTCWGHFYHRDGSLLDSQQEKDW